ncbi:hypothetical protein AS594_35295 [Streptomyces agglomeratus]|uniref:Uncharacterized protein n=1 Tax=Streptomyces agglomeratus TaxID=285458 RepID=A0A1E5PHA5_9ACTN|nr:hypothetical protein AS594_35295 [Streptomyces agglomeratus]
MKTTATGTARARWTAVNHGVRRAHGARPIHGGQVLLSDTNKDGKADLTATAPLEDGTYADSAPPGTCGARPAA